MVVVVGGGGGVREDVVLNISVVSGGSRQNQYNYDNAKGVPDA